MDEMDENAIECSTKLLEGVELALLHPPVELVSPISQQLSEILQVGPLFPRRPWALIRPAGEPQALVQVVKGFLSKTDRERLDRHVRPLLLLFFNKSVRMYCIIAARVGSGRDDVDPA